MTPGLVVLLRAMHKSDFNYHLPEELIAQRPMAQRSASRLLVVASPQVVDKILDDQSTIVAELEETIGKSIRFQREDQYTREQFDVVLL